MTAITLIGFVAGGCTLCSLLPQIAKVCRTKRAGDLSMGMLCLLFVGALLWGIYGTMLKELPIIIFNLIYLALLSYQIILKRKYDK
jgi:MtN3 and saliva related transmembrane protein